MMAIGHPHVVKLLNIMMIGSYVLLSSLFPAFPLIVQISLEIACAIELWIRMEPYVPILCKTLRYGPTSVAVNFNVGSQSYFILPIQLSAKLSILNLPHQILAQIMCSLLTQFYAEENENVSHTCILRQHLHFECNIFVCFRSCSKFFHGPVI